VQSGTVFEGTNPDNCTIQGAFTGGEVAFSVVCTSDPVCTDYYEFTGSVNDISVTGTYEGGDCRSVYSPNRQTKEDGTYEPGCTFWGAFTAELTRPLQ